jgi:transposase
MPYSIRVDEACIFKIKQYNMEKTGYLGCDVSKGYCDFILLGSGKEVLATTFILQDNKEGRDQLLASIKKWESEGLTALFCGVESTGGYENNWFRFLRGLAPQMGLAIKTARLNPKGVKAVTEANLSRTITDAVSARNIALYLMLFPEKVEYGHSSTVNEEGIFSDGRQHHTYIKMLLKQKVQLNNQLEKLLYQNFSEILVYCRHGAPKFVLKLLVEYPGALEVCKAGTEKLSLIKGISTQKANSIIRKASTSEQNLSDHIKHLVSATSKELLHKTELIAAEKSRLEDRFKSDPQVILLSSVDGIGPSSAVSLLLEIEDVKRFATAQKMTSYFGVHPCFKQSGDGIWGNHMSKKGRGEIRAVLYMAAMTGIWRNPTLKKLYKRFREKGMKHYQAMGVVMHKLLRIVYGILKNQTAFDATVDEKNITKANEAKQKDQEVKSKDKKAEKKTLGHKLAMMDAPISRRKYQQIKKAASVPELKIE